MTCQGFDSCCLPFLCEEVAETPEDECPPYDTDCDSMSNAVEANDANSYLQLDPDVNNCNPSIAHGEPYNGWIEDALNLVNSGTGYTHYIGPDPLDSDDWGVLAMINMIEGAGRDWLEYGLTPPRIQVGDISWGNAATQQFGGEWPMNDHDSHRNGLDVDVRYIRLNGAEGSLNIGDSLQFPYYNANATAQMLNCFIVNGVIIKMILSEHHSMNLPNDPSYQIDIDYSGKHDDHIHLRIEDPDGIFN